MRTTKTGRTAAAAAVAALTMALAGAIVVTVWTGDWRWMLTAAAVLPLLFAAPGAAAYWADGDTVAAAVTSGSAVVLATGGTLWVWTGTWEYAATAVVLAFAALFATFLMMGGEQEHRA